MILKVALISMCAVFTLAGRTVTVDPTIEYQTFEGWGTSLCWWAHIAGGWEERARSELIGAIIDPDTGLGYTCFRYNIGGGDNPTHTHLKGRYAVPGFKPTEKGDYDWTADQNQRTILLEIADRGGSSCVFEAFSNSPPWWMTISGCASGNTNGADNLKSDYFDTFADYLATVVKQYKDEWGVSFRTVEPFNEPSSGYWKPNERQEGCGFRSNQSKMVVELGKQLEEKGLFPEVTISAADETSLSHTVTSINGYSEEALHYLSQINSHSYDGWNSRKTVYEIAEKLKKNLWQSESGPLSKNDNSDITMWMSHVIIQDLRVMKANAWIDWQVCDDAADWQTIRMSSSSESFQYTKRYYMHAAFSRFIRPGSRIIHSSDTNSIAAVVPSTGNMVVVLRNNSSRSVEYDVDLSKCETVPEKGHLYRFALAGSLEQLDDVAVDEMKMSFTAPSQSITTCVIPQSVALRRAAAAPLPPGLEIVPGSGGCVRLVCTAPVSFAVRIFNVKGRLVFARNATADRSATSIDLSHAGLSDGLYVVSVRTADGVSVEKSYYYNR